MSERFDLTRWNRAGLSRFRYLNGNAVTYLEDLRKAFLSVANFKNWEALSAIEPVEVVNPDSEKGEIEAASAPRWVNQNQAPDDETEAERIERLLDTYHRDREEWAWEIARVFARACHVLTEHIDAYANEGYLGTATQWDNIRRLVETIDYHPAPPASASAPLIIMVKSGESGTVEAGFQVKYTPEDGSEPLLFETLDDLEVDPDLNQMYPLNYNRNQKIFKGKTITIDEEIEDLVIGEPLVLEDENSGNILARIIKGFSIAEGKTLITLDKQMTESDPKSDSFRIGYTKIHLLAKDQLSLTGPAFTDKVSLPNPLHLTTEPEGLLPGMVVWIGDGVNTCYRFVASVTQNRVKLSVERGEKRLDSSSGSGGAELNLSVGQVARPVTITAANEGGSTTSDAIVFKVAGDWTRLHPKMIAMAKSDNSIINSLPVFTVKSALYTVLDQSNPSAGGYTQLNLSYEGSDAPLNLEDTVVFYVPPVNDKGEWETDTYLEEGIPSAITTEKAKKTSSGDLVVMMKENQYGWARLESVSTDAVTEETKLTTADGWKEEGSGLYYLTETTVYGHFSKDARIDSWQVNDQSISGTDIPLNSIPDNLQKGRRIIVCNSENSELNLDTSVADVQDNTAVLSTSLPSGFTYGNTILYGNVVTCGHGESKGVKVLGSGNASRTNQSFLFAEEDVSFTADSTQPSGVRAAIGVKVDGESWEQIGNLNYSEPTDKQYTVRMAEGGYLLIGFGDSRKGRRLPTGTNNVKISYRKGTGLKGNINSGSITKPAKPHRLVDSVMQPFDATGGNDMEGVESLRENAPATLLALERAVSLVDFSNLASSHSSVWQAKAFPVPTGIGRNEKIEVVVVPANGGELGDLADTVRSYLEENSLPNVDISVEKYKELKFSLDVTLNVNTTGYDPEDVVEEVKTTLETEFTLEKRKLGQAVYLSEVYKIVEAVAGVVNSKAILNGNPQQLMIPTIKKAVRVLDECHVDYGGSAVQTATGIPDLKVVRPPVAILPIGARDPSIIQGIGTEYKAILSAEGIDTIEALAKIDPEVTLLDMSATKRWRFRTRAKLILESEFDSTHLFALKNYSINSILEEPASELSADTGLTVEVIEETKVKLRRMQNLIDDEILDRISLKELFSSSR